MANETAEGEQAWQSFGYKLKMRLPRRSFRFAGLAPRNDSKDIFISFLFDSPLLTRYKE